MFGPKRTLKSLMQELEAGLRDGTIVLDPRAAKQPSEVRAYLSATEPPALTWLPLASLAQGSYQSYIGDPVATVPRPGQKRDTRAGYRDTGVVVVARGARQAIVRDAVVQ